MARGRYNKSLPKKIVFFENSIGTFFGPYMKKPTAAFKDDEGNFITFTLDENGNYIRQDDENV